MTTTDLKPTEAAPVVVLYHNDMDGFAAALVCWLQFGARAQYHAVQYEEPLPEIPDGAEVYIVDFSYDEEILIALANRSVLVQVIDHHKTAKAALEHLNGECDRRLQVRFDVLHSGAWLTWEFFHPFKATPSLLLYIEDRDLWKWKLNDSREIAAALALKDFKFERWAELLEDFENADVRALFVAKGRNALALINQTARTAAKHSRMGSVGGYQVPTVNATTFISETCHEMLELHPEAPFVAAWYEDERGKKVWSLRSRPGFDVSEVARKLGGGGHAQAAGFTEEALRIENARDALRIQGENGNWNTCPYMHGFYNGMECALAILEYREAKYRPAPERWLDQKGMAAVAVESEVAQ